MKSEIFEQARQHFSRNLVETLIPGGEWKGDDYWPVSPLRSDSKPGSFHISESGLWKDFASDEGGDLIDLVARLKSCDKLDAAREIIRMAGGSVPAPTAKPKKPKPAALMPIPTAEGKSLQALAKASPRGQVKKAWRYYDATGGWVFSVVRYDKPAGGKDVIPYYLTAEGWREGMPIANARPMYHLPELLAHPDLPVLVVEGERCADVEVPGYVVVTWSSGASSVDKTDWSPLAKRDVTIWPDADEPGQKAAHALARRLPDARVLYITDRAQGWDIADAAAEGMDLERFLEECPRLTEPDHEDEDSAAPFRFLGYDAACYWFLKKNQDLPFTIPKGNFTASKLQELAKIEWWALMGCVKKNGSVDVQRAQDLVVDESEKSGIFTPDTLRGAGVWRDGDKIIINDGRNIVDINGKKTPLSYYKGEASYVVSPSVNFGDMTGASATIEQGKTLSRLFAAQGFSSRSEAVAAMGWSLISPFGGMLKWRSHLWVSGQTGTGKSYVVSDIINTLCGPFSHLGSGKDTEAGIRRTLNMDARPVVLDEMEPKNKGSRERIDKILDLARNSSGDGSGYVTMANAQGGVDNFIIRSCFCFASINVPDDGQSITNRVIKCELKKPIDQGKKIRTSLALYEQCMADPGAYRRRIFRALPHILADIEAIKTSLGLSLASQRKGDVWAPLLAAAWAAVSDESITTEAGKAWIASLFDDIEEKGHESDADEDRAIEHILSAQIRTDDAKMRTVAELLEDSAKDVFERQGGFDWATAILSRQGIKLRRFPGGFDAVIFACHADTITKLLQDTPYGSSYDAQIKRNDTCTNPENGGIQEYFRCGRKKARRLDWKKFKEKYMGEEVV